MKTNSSTPMPEEQSEKRKEYKVKSRVKKLRSRCAFHSAFSSGGQTRTDDLRVMSPTSYQLLHPAIYL